MVNPPGRSPHLRSKLAALICFYYKIDNQASQGCRLVFGTNIGSVLLSRMAEARGQIDHSRIQRLHSPHYRLNTLLPKQLIKPAPTHNED
jgi:hypothetical protein